jgi:hypothetical protein
LPQAASQSQGFHPGLGQIDFSRAKQLLGSPAESREAYDQAQKELPTANAQVNESLAAAQPTGLRSPRTVGSSSLTVG